MTLAALAGVRRDLEQAGEVAVMDADRGGQRLLVVASSTNSPVSG